MSRLHSRAAGLALPALGLAGAATLTLPQKVLKRGSYLLTAAYQGSEAVTASSSTFTVTITDSVGK